MAKSEGYTQTTGSTDDNSAEDKAVKYYEEWKKWRNDLEPYWPEIDKDQEMYEFYKQEYTETSSDVSLNTPFSIIESMVAKFNDSSLQITVRAKGLDGLDTFEEYIAAVAHDTLEDPDVAQYKGTFRKTKEVGIREFLVKGILFSEDNYFYKTDPETGAVLVDNPYCQILPYKSVIFNPAYPADESPVHYVEKRVSYADLMAQEEKVVEETVEGEKIKTRKGLYTNLGKLKELAKKENKLIDAEDEHFYSDGKKVARKVEPIKLLERWEGTKLCVIACIGKGKEIIREAVDPKKTGNSGLNIAMNYKIAGRPYPYGEVRAIYKIVRAQDTVLNQSIEVINRYLRPAVFVNDTDADLDQYIMLMERGGVGYGDFTKIGSPQLNLPPGQAFQSVDVLQQAIERTARYSPYASSGIPSQATDKTQGTATGIQALQVAAEPNFQVKLDTIQDSWLRPMTRNHLKMVGNLMEPGSFRYAYLRGENPQWVKATKGMLTGKATIGDMVQVGMIEANELQDPLFMESLMREFGVTTPAEVLEETVVFDTDWILDAKLDSQSAADKDNDFISEQEIIAFGQQMGVQYNPERTVSYFANKRNFSRHDDLMLTEEEKQELMNQELEMKKEQEAAAVAQQEQAVAASEDQAKQAEIERLEAEAAALEKEAMDYEKQKSLMLQRQQMGAR